MPTLVTVSSSYHHSWVQVHIKCHVTALNPFFGMKALTVHVSQNKSCSIYTCLVTNRYRGQCWQRFFCFLNQVSRDGFCLCHVYMLVRVSACLRPLITSHVKWSHTNWLSKCYSFSVYFYETCC